MELLGHSTVLFFTSDLQLRLSENVDGAADHVIYVLMIMCGKIYCPYTAIGAV